MARALPNRSPVSNRSFTSLFAVAGLLAACDPPAPPARRGFYSWRAAFSLSATERAALEQQHVERLYLRFFDIELGQAGSGPAGPAVVAPVTLGEEPALPRGVEIVPVVFLKNQALSHLGAGGAARLAEQLFAEVQKRAGLLGAGPVRELQRAYGQPRDKELKAQIAFQGAKADFAQQVFERRGSDRFLEGPLPVPASWHALLAALEVHGLPEGGARRVRLLLALARAAPLRPAGTTDRARRLWPPRALLSAPAPVARTLRPR